MTCSTSKDILLCSECIACHVNKMRVFHELQLRLYMLPLTCTSWIICFRLRRQFLHPRGEYSSAVSPSTINLGHGPLSFFPACSQARARAAAREERIRATTILVSTHEHVLRSTFCGALFLYICSGRLHAVDEILGCPTDACAGRTNGRA